MLLEYAKGSRRYGRSIACLTVIVVTGTFCLYRWSPDVMLRVEAIGQQRKCERFWRDVKGSTRISSEMSQRSTGPSSGNMPEYVRRFEQISRAYPCSDVIVFLGRVRVTSSEEIIAIVRLNVWHIRDVVFSLRFNIETYRTATLIKLPAEVKDYGVNVDLYARGSSDAPSFNAGYRDPSDDTRFIIPCKFNGVDWPIVFILHPDSSLEVKVPAGWPGTPE
jgi:hypothetical protein